MQTYVKIMNIEQMNHAFIYLAPSKYPLNEILYSLYLIDFHSISDKLSACFC